jgi:hypothetical protein
LLSTRAAILQQFRGYCAAISQP